MSAHDNHTAHEEEHTGPVKTPKQFLLMAFFSLVIPIFAIIGLVYYVTSANMPAMGAGNMEKSIADRILKVGSVEIRDANRPLKAGADVYAAQCVACHASGAAGAPKFGDVAAWAPRLKTGFEALWNSALKGKNAMGPQGGGDFNDIEIGRAVVYLTASAGGKFAEPAAAAAAAPGEPASAPAPMAAAPVAAAAVVVAAAPAATVGAGQALYQQACVACHAAGVAGSPKFADKAAWAPRIKTGIDAMTASVIKGKGIMPPKGGSSASDADIRSAVEYMASAAK
ncbi:MAG: cytochrome c5 [Litorivivens sp.]|jgi:cytochrome c5